METNLVNQKYINKKIYTFSIVYPSGNTTALVKGIPNKQIRILINKKIQSLYPEVEQVGFYSFKKKLKLEMAGGEFCGNALRSLAYLALKGKKGVLQISVSGVKKPLLAGIKTSYFAFAQMPVNNKTKIAKLKNNLWQVDLEGITHLVIKNKHKLRSIKAKRLAKKILLSTNLMRSKKAAGVVFVRTNPKSYTLFIEPVVWVKDVQTFYYETACASGTTAVGIWYANTSSSNSVKLLVKQPSGYSISVSIQKRNAVIVNALIDGPVKRISQNNLISL